VEVDEPELVQLVRVQVDLAAKSIEVTANGPRECDPLLSTRLGSPPHCPSLVHNSEEHGDLAGGEHQVPSIQKERGWQTDGARLAVTRDTILRLGTVVAQEQPPLVPVAHPRWADVDEAGGYELVEGASHARTTTADVPRG
jgi:hypothetical protein